MNTYIYIHVCCVNNWVDVFQDIMCKIRDSGLYDYVNAIRCCILGSSYESHSYLFNDPKIEILETNPNTLLFEPFTINRLYRDACETVDTFRVLYLHTKGVRHYGTNPNVIDWINYLCYFNIYHFKLCIHILSVGASTVGVNMHENPVLHYSGNFWWSNSDHIRKVGPCVFEIYQSPEYWITEQRIGTHISIHQSNVGNHYLEPYPPEKYVNSDIVVLQK